MAMIYEIPRGSLETGPMSLDYDSGLVTIQYYDAGGVEIFPTVMATISVSRTLSGENFKQIYAQALHQWAFEGPAGRLRVALTGTGATTAALKIWRGDDAGSGIPSGAFSGLRAMTFQNYIEANVKNGVQYEIASDNLALAIGGNIDTIFTTGANPVVIKSRIVKFNGTHLTTRVYRAPTYTGGTITPYFNLNDRNPVAGTVVIRAGATVSAVGTEFGAPTFDIGSTNIGNTSVSTYTTLGIERILAPNTTYLQRITNDSSAIQEVTSYLSWFEGNTDLPLA